MIAVFGSGFGLYGYLPALVKGCGQRVILTERHRHAFNERPELRRFADAIEWKRDEAQALDFADGVVLALPPRQQVHWAAQCLGYRKVQRLLLEKPLAPSPAVAAGLLDDLGRSGIRVRIGYTFRYTDWGERLRAALKRSASTGRLRFEWSFLAHHFRHDLDGWKRFTHAGGGAIRFYGIQLIALLAELGYRVVNLSDSSGVSPDVIVKWTASFGGRGLPECECAIDTRNPVEKFSVALGCGPTSEPDVVLGNLTDPFELPGTVFPELDRRVPVLTRLCRSLWEEDVDHREWYKATIELWRQIEETNHFQVNQVAGPEGHK